MSSKSDREATLSRSRIPIRVTSTGTVVETGEEVVVTAIHVKGGAADTVIELRDGDGTGDPKWEMDAPTGADADQAFPQGLVFDGLHVTTPGGDEVVYLATSHQP